MKNKKVKKLIAEYRTLPSEEKGFIEKREALVEEMRTIVDNAKAETRALSDDDTKRYNEIKAEIEGIDATLTAIEEQRTIETRTIAKKDREEETRTAEEIANEELRYIFTGQVPETRAASSMNTTTNAEGGFVVNKELSQNIIKEIKDRSDVYKFFNGTSIKGNLRIPKQASSGTAEWVTENPTTDPTATIPTLDIIELGQNRLYRESAITQQMVNVEELDLQGFVKVDIADTMTDAIESAIFNGTGTGQPTGIVNGIKAKNKITVDTRGEITVDDFKKAKAKIKQNIVKNAKWFMNAETFLLVDLIKDGMGRPLLQPNVADGTGYTILGLPVVLTDAMALPTDTGAKCLVVLATPEAYHTNTQKALALYVYNDSAYIRRGLIGYGADIYLDGKVKDDQQVSGIFNKAS
ncbi:phage major capsid protein [Clostridium butyricum]|uniref:Phage major capsid protein, HK97 family n=1 Tax=Clostridium butyricum E4 str. BoNT E BL5262 TaxID=632245 RepID=C4II33_CLOBU|nr:phage major capsid protein [Clostridium butyricum]EDT75852.1 phage major capsid protein, HK97 family [Clostridium butyricum 5521]EEP53623.1 phage major capsid protein, HK97 family [Clostridium butyricum E4 str. BoNT E BL5262]NFL33217.1 phage major capsid protein [Clostridium butyricum]NFS20421.1 phage major capsid protein [Clostridium butyricum]